MNIYRYCEGEVYYNSQCLSCATYHLHADVSPDCIIAQCTTGARVLAKLKKVRTTSVMNIDIPHTCMYDYKGK